MKFPRKQRARSSRRKTSFPAVPADGRPAYRQTKLTATGWKPISQDRQDAYPLTTHQDSQQHYQKNTANDRHCIEERKGLIVGTFEPEYAGKMDFYLNLLNDKERGPDDQPSIGIILCAEKDDVEVEYALRTKTNPIGVAAYQLQTKLPTNLKGKLPSAKQLADLVRGEMDA